MLTIETENAWQRTLMGRGARIIAILSLIGVLLAGCASTGGPGYESGSVAETTYDTGDYETAWRIYDAQARRAGASALARLKAADAALLTGRFVEAETYLQMLDHAQLSPEHAMLAQLLDIILAPEVYSPEQIIERTATPPPQNSPHLADFYRLRSTALEQSAQPFAAARELMELDRLELGERQTRINSERIIALLQTIPVNIARQYRESVDDAVTKGWLDLIILMKETMVAGRDVRTALANWERVNPDHPASGNRLFSALDRIPVATDQKRLVGVLLPASGPLAGAGQAVRDGIVSAYLAATNRNSEVRFYDTAGNVPGALTAYQQARDDGATHIIGPLDRPAARRILQDADGSITILALNYADESDPVNGFQLGLLPEQDARAAAARMIADGRLRAVTMTPAGEWGDRLRSAFITQFEDLGGVVFESATYPDSMRDFGPTIKRTVGTNDAVIRHRRLQSMLGVPLNAHPLHRHDVDALFVGARSTDGRLIVPQLDFHEAGDIPVYATSHIYSGAVDAAADKDLEGVRFCDSPWLLGTIDAGYSYDDASTELSTAKGGSARLFALGMDAWRLVPYLEWLVQFPTDRFPGATGAIGIGDAMRLDRQPTCAQFVDGQPRPLETRELL